MASLGEQGFRLIARAYWSGNDLDMATEIARRESGFDPLQHNDNYKRGGGDNSYGLMQINMIDKNQGGNIDLGASRRAKYGISNESLFNPATNLRVAREIQRESGWGPWSTSAQAAQAVTQGGGGEEPPTPSEVLDAGEMTIFASIPSTISSVYGQQLLAGDIPVFARPEGLTDEQWDVLLKYGRAVIEGSSGSFVDQIVGQASDVAGVGLEWAQALAKLLSILIDPEFWKRIGLGVLAAVVVIIAFMVYNKDAIIDTVDKVKPL